MNRNAPCACGSGKRHKHCCGNVAAVSGTVPASAEERAQPLKYEALRRQRADELDVAEALYRQFLAQVPGDADALHMLGVVCYQTDRFSEAVALILDAARLTNWEISDIRYNLALAASAALRGDDGDTLTRRIAYRMWQRQRSASRRAVQPLVSIVVPSYCHREYIGECLRSVFRQSYRNLELIVIDDGSTDGSPAIIEEVLKDCSFPTRFIARENRGAHATINEGIALARGEFVNVLNSDDRFAPQRMARMVEEVAQINAEWGFSGVEIIDGSGEPVTNPQTGTRAWTLERILADGPRSLTLGFGLLKANFAITTGNLFVSREFFLRLGGFSPLRYNHDWEFALRATLESEPVHIADRLYAYRLHGHNTIAESTSGPREEAGRMFAEYWRANSGAPVNPFAPSEVFWGRRYLAAMLPCLSSDSMILKDIFSQGLTGLMAGVVAQLPMANFPDDTPAARSVLQHIGNPRFSAKGADDAMPFDQTQRYRVAALAIEALRQPGQKFRVLEVGANQHRRLGAVLPQDDIVYLDREISDCVRGAADVVAGDATALEFPDGHFDVVVALDVLEHVAAQRRTAFLRHTTWAARLLTIVAAPFDAPEVRAAEMAALGFRDALLPEPCRWLTEHARQGLPNLGETEAVLAELGVRHCTVGHGRLDLWSGMLKGHFAAEAMPELLPAMRALDDFYARHVVSADFADSGVYRRFLFCSRDAEVDARLAAQCQGFIETSARADAVDAGGAQGVLRALHELAAAQRPTAAAADR